MTIRKLAVMTAAMFSLAACGGEAAPEAGSEDVVTMRTDPAVTAPAAAPADRVIIRPDDTQADVDNKVQAYLKCLDDHGATQWKNAEGKYDKPPADAMGQLPAVTEEVTAAAEAACANTNPEHWTDVEQRTNPEYPDLLRIAGKCVADKGFDATVRQEDGFWYIGYSSNDESNRAHDTERACMAEAFAARIAQNYE